MIALVIAKAPVPGLAKTRLCPPLDPQGAAAVASAALLDTLDTVLAWDARPVVALTGDLSRAMDSAELRAALSGVTVLPQHGPDFATRLANAHGDAARLFPGEPVVQIGMDTPQVSTALLAECAAGLSRADVVIGPAVDGGWWSLGLRDPRHALALTGVPMSTARTCACTVDAFRARGLTVRWSSRLSDVDTVADAARVAEQVFPASRFARAVRSSIAGIRERSIASEAVAPRA